jgi:hypothetical protein
MSSATSSGRPGLPIGVLRPATSSSSVEEPVSIQPGATELTVTPRRATSIARARVRPSIPALAAAYPDERGLATSGPVTDDTFTTRPEPRSSMCGMTSLVTLNAVLRLRARSRSHEASLISSNRTSSCAPPTWTIPALFTRTSIRSKRASTPATTARACAAAVRSATNPAESIPSPPSSLARSWIRSVVEARATLAPPRPSARAVANPIPLGLPAPVTSATRPRMLSSPTTFSSRSPTRFADVRSALGPGAMSGECRGGGRTFGRWSGGRSPVGCLPGAWKGLGRPPCRFTRKPVSASPDASVR